MNGLVGLREVHFPTRGSGQQSFMLNCPFLLELSIIFSKVYLAHDGWIDAEFQTQASKFYQLDHEPTAARMKQLLRIPLIPESFRSFLCAAL